MKTNSEGLKLIDEFCEDYRVFLSRKEAEKAVKRLVKVRLNSNQFSALVSFVMSEGLVSFKKSKLLELVNYGNHFKAAEQFEFYIYLYDDEGNQKLDRDLIPHREAEKALYLKFEDVKKE